MQSNTILLSTPLTDFHCIEWGQSGPKILLLHGFPESPHIFEALARLLVAKGFHVFAPYLPGYGPTAPLNVNSAVTHLGDLARSLSDLAKEISPSERELILLGHDWGAVIAYATAALAPERFKRLHALAVPPLPSFLKGLLRFPGQWLRSDYMLFFQLRLGIPEAFLKSKEHSRLKSLCLKWSGGAEPSTEYFSEHQDAFGALGNLSSPLSYYRGLFPVLSGSLSKWRASIKLAFSQIDVPTKIYVGEQDGCIPAPLYKNFERYFLRGVTLEVVPKAGHFLPLDVPALLAKRILSSGSH